MELIQALPVAASVLGESPLWHPVEQVLYWCDIPGRRLNRFDPARDAHKHWDFDSDLACCAARADGGLLLAQRDGLWEFETASGSRKLLAPPPYDTTIERFNDGKVDAAGRFWVGTIYEPRDKPAASLYRWSKGLLERMAGDITVSNGLAWSPDGGSMYWADTWAHTLCALDFDNRSGMPTRRRALATFPKRTPDTSLDHYGGRPDGATVDAEGCIWIAMFEGARVLRLAPSGEVLQTLQLPVRCPTMPCLGGPDLRTLYITTGREKRPPQELDAMPLSGCVLQVRVDVPGLPANLVR